MRIAIVKLSALGDIVHAMAVLQFIKKYNQEILIDWVVEENYLELVKFNPDINQVHLINLKRAKRKKSLFLLLSELIKIRKLDSYDLVIDMQGLMKSALISKLIKSKKTIGFDKESIRERFASFFYTDKFNFEYSKNVIERNYSLIEFALGLSISKEQIQSKVPFLFTRKNRLDIKLSRTKKNILLIPGASHISKCYPPTKFAEITSLIDANFFISWGSFEEKMLADKIQVESDNVVVCNKQSIDELIFLISKSDLVIGSDTGPTHIAWALNIPSITLFGPTPGNRNTWETRINKIIESDSKVDSFKINKNDFSIKNIQPKVIVKMAQELINK